MARRPDDHHASNAMLEILVPCRRQKPYWVLHREWRKSVPYIPLRDFEGFRLWRGFRAV